MIEDEKKNDEIRMNRFMDYETFPVKVLSKEESEALLKKLGR